MNNTNMGTQKTLKKKSQVVIEISKHKMLYLFLLPSVLAVLIFQYLTMVGVIIAFQDFDIFRGYFGSKFVGFKNFVDFLSDDEFYRVFFYTIKVSVMSFAFGFPAPIILAVLFNELKFKKFKKFTQSVSYLPNFLSWVVAAAFVISAFEPAGLVNKIFIMLGLETIDFLSESQYFIPMLVISGLWKGAGWGSIIYLANISNIDPQLYEAAVIDGANRWKQTIYITLPSMKPLIIIMFIYSISGLLSVNFEQVFQLQNPLIRMETNVISTYVYYKGIQRGEYSLASAFGLFQAVLSFGLLSTANYISKKTSKIRIW